MLKNLIDAKNSIEIQIGERVCQIFRESVVCISYDFTNSNLEIEFQSGKTINISLDELYEKDFLYNYAQRSAAYN